jgi:MFS superfamily sulfate permease-like transporter
MFAHWKQDLPASLVVFLVALPLCMGIALASGAPVATGLITAIIGGLVVGMLAGAPLQVSGPAAGLTVICAGVISQFGLTGLGIVVLLAGFIQLVAGLCRLGQWFRAVSPAVVHGMLSGIGVLIVVSQLHVLVDIKPHGHGLENIVAIPESVARGLPWPQWEGENIRRTRIHLLKELSKLHERQGEVDRAVSRVVTMHGSKRVHDTEEAQLPSFAPQQAAVLADLRKIWQEHLAQPEVLGTRAEELDQALAKADSALSKALADLESHSLYEVEESQHEASEAVAGALEALESHPWAAKIGVLSIIVLVLWKRYVKGPLAQVPPPLVAVVTAVLAAWLLSLPVLYVEVPDDLRNGLTFPTWTVFEDFPIRDVLIAGLTMAAIASAETLLCATAVDKLHDGQRTQYDRELCAQGIGNMLCGCVGALPMTGVIVRSAANVKAGAKTRLSAILHGLWMLMFVLFLAPLLRMIPVSALAGILVYIGFQLIDFKGFFRLWKESKSEALILLITMVVIVVDHLLTGVITGIVLSALKLLFTFSWLDVQVTNDPPKQGRARALLKLAGAATFIRLPILAQALEKIPPDTDVRFDFSRLDYIDHACFELLSSWCQQRQSCEGTLILDWKQLHARLQEPQRKADSTAAHSAA